MGSDNECAPYYPHTLIHYMQCTLNEIGDILQRRKARIEARDTVLKRILATLKEFLKVLQPLHQHLPYHPKE